MASSIAAPERLSIDGPSGALEALLEWPVGEGPQAGPREFAAVGIVCHPHPLFGGAMTNKVVHTVARAFRDHGAPTLRFNFRGVGASGGQYDEGRGETEDLLAVAAWAARRLPGAALWLAGFSFGSWVALRALDRLAPQRLVTVAPPVGRWDFGALTRPRCPWLIVQGDQDELVDARLVANWAEATGAGPRLEVLAGADHFFHGRLHDLRDAVSGFLGMPAGSDQARSV
jgi:alpha/beta superfamily hydrolase